MREVLGMNSTTYMIAGVLFVILGIVGIYYVREAPGLALFALIGLIAGIAMIGKATGKL
jgi:F0F1-type ATP synthase assembly protein I